MVKSTFGNHVGITKILDLPDSDYNPSFGIQKRIPSLQNKYETESVDAELLLLLLLLLQLLTHKGTCHQLHRMRYNVMFSSYVYFEM